MFAHGEATFGNLKSSQLSADFIAYFENILGFSFNY